MTTATIDTAAALDAAERALQELQAEEADGEAALRRAASSGDVARVRDLQARQAILPILLPAAREQVLRARLAHGETERAAVEEALATAREESQRAGEAMRAAADAFLAAREACHGPGLWLADAERRLELLGDQRRATLRALADELGMVIGDDGELQTVAAEDAERSA